MILEKQQGGVYSESEINKVEELPNDCEEFVLGMFDVGAIRFGEFSWTYHDDFPNAPKAPMYFEIRDVAGDPELNLKAVEIMMKKIAVIEFNKIAGIPMSITAIASSIKDRYRMGLITPRKEAKRKGSGKLVDGFFQEDVGQTTLLLDDVLARGGSKINAGQTLRKEGAVVEDIACYMDYCLGGSRVLEDKRYKVHSIWTVEQVLNSLIRNNRIGIYLYLGIMGRFAEMRRFFKQVDSQEALIS